LKEINAITISASSDTRSDIPLVLVLALGGGELLVAVNRDWRGERT
jgi:hypothetical protein